MSLLPTGTAASDFALVWVTGEDAHAFLQGLITQNVLVPPGTVTRSFMLEPRGKIRAVMWIINDDDRLGLITNEAPVVLDTLEKYKIRVKAEISMDPRGILLEFGSEFGWEWTEATGALTVNAGSIRFLVGGAEGVSLTEEEALEARILLGEPLVGIDLDEKSMVHGTPLVSSSISFEKGCYLGQELVSRIQTRGRSPQRMVGLCGEGSPPIVHSTVTLSDKVIGNLTSVVSTETGFIALGIVGASATVGDQVFAGGVVATLVELPFPDLTTA